MDKQQESARKAVDKLTALINELVMVKGMDVTIGSEDLYEIANAALLFFCAVRDEKLVIRSGRSGKLEIQAK